MKKLLLLAALASSSYAQSIKICANKTSGNLFLRPSCFGSERAITNLSALRGHQGPQGVPGPAGSFSSCYQITAYISADRSEINYELTCNRNGLVGELTYHSELFPSYATKFPTEEFIPYVDANGKTTGGIWIVQNEHIESTGTIPTGLCCPLQ